MTSEKSIDRRLLHVAAVILIAATIAGLWLKSGSRDRSTDARGGATGNAVAGQKPTTDTGSKPDLAPDSTTAAGQPAVPTQTAQPAAIASTAGQPDSLPTLFQHQRFHLPRTARRSHPPAPWQPGVNPWLPSFRAPT